MKRRLFIFNPDCELSIANGSQFFTPSANIVKMAMDLAFLPAYYADATDYVLVKSLPDRLFMETVCHPLNLGCKVVMEDALENDGDTVGIPWGWSPKVCHWLYRKGMGEEWKPEQKNWYSRNTAREAVSKLLKVLPYLENGIRPQICNTIEEIQEKIAGGCYVVKAPWSSSGKGLLRLENHANGKEEEWLRGMLRKQGYLMLEKYLDKVQDFAMEFYSGEEGVEFVGWSSFQVGEHGEYKGNYVGPQERLEEMLIVQLGKQVIVDLQQIMPKILRELLPSYRGFLGVDMMVYRNIRGEFCLQPCVEINLRYNMGIVALFLSRRYVAEEKEGFFEIRYYPGDKEALAEHLRLKNEHPAVYKNNRIESGYLNLTPVNDTTHFIASLICY